MPVNRGFPLAGTTTPSQRVFFESPSAVDGQLLYLVTAYARGAELSGTATVARQIDTSGGDPAAQFEIVTVYEDNVRYSLFENYPVRGIGRRVVLGNVDPTVVTYGYVEIDDVDQRQTNRPFANVRLQKPFTVPLIRPQLGDPEILVHELDKGYADLVTLTCQVPDGMTLELRFYNGTFSNSVPNFLTIPIINASGFTLTDSFFDRHPMIGPGSIRALVTESADPDDTAFIYGSVYR